MVENGHEIEARELTVAEIKTNVNLIQQVMKSVMQNGTHYGTIPGCGDKPALLKAGAEKLASTFRLGPEIIVNDLSTLDEKRYRVITRLIHQTTGKFLGEGVGECSSNEEKYKWRRVVCDEEWEDTPEDRRREVWKKGWKDKPPYKVKQIRTQPADVANTVLKMAKKRSFVDGILSVTAASDIFTQDIDESDDVVNGQPPLQKPQRASEQQETKRDGLTKEQQEDIVALCKKHDISSDTLKAYMLQYHGTNKKAELTVQQYIKTCEWITQHKK